jgi:hypothetical protein
MRRRKSLLLLLGLILISLSKTASRAETQVQHFLHGRGVRRVEPVDIRLPVFNRFAAGQFAGTHKSGSEAASRIKLDFFPDVSLMVNLNQVETLKNNTLVWYGQVEGTLYGNATFVLSENALTGSVTRGDGKIYELRTAEDGTQWSLEIDQSQLPGERDPVAMPKNPSDAAALPEPDALAYGDDGSTIDVMVLYTPAARQAVGTTSSMQQMVQLAVALTNQGYANSGVIQRIRLVETREINYVEGANITTDLQRLASANDGFLDNALTLRDTLGADLVSLWVHTPESTCGIGYQMTNTSFSPSALSVVGFSVVEQACATANYTFSHEMGHNMGAAHARDDLTSNGQPPVGAYSYSFGYKQTSGINKFRTIMAYDAGCSCPRIDYWSNPNVAFNGLPTGIDSNSTQAAANYLTLNNTRTIVANFRASGGSTTTTDSTGPQLTITSHTNGQTVSSGAITISGTASDAGRGDSGISSVTVNGVRASGDTAVGTATANWSRSLTLTNGANAFTIVAKDASANQNSTTVTITITLNTSTETTSATASTYHVFPQFADGRMDDGTSYRTTVMIANTSRTSGTTCTLRLNGLTVDGSSTLTYTLVPNGWTISPTSGTQSFRSGYASLQCSVTVEAQLLYSFYSPSGAKLSEATVFSSPPAAWAQLLADGREGSRVGIAIANDSDQSTTYAITAGDASGSQLGSTSLTLGPRSSRAAFLDELLSIPSNSFGPVYVSSNSGMASIIGLRYTGTAFTTIPATSRSVVGATASTYHIFPQFADGILSDGTYYRTTLMISNPSSSEANCTLRLYGLTINGYNTYTVTLSTGAWSLEALSSTQSLRSGYATLQCSASVEAQLLYSFYSPAGAKISEATVFSSASSRELQLLADGREGARLGLAIANDTDEGTTYSLVVGDAAGNTVGTTSITLAARSARAAFLDEFLPIPPGNYGQVLLSSSGGSASLIGLRFTGGNFTTIPETIR